MPARLRREEGFGLVELLIAMTVLAVGILALVAGFSSGYVALGRASTISTATVLADKQMERFRSLPWSKICLSNSSAAAGYASAAPAGTPLVTCATTDPARTATQDPVTGPDGHPYRVDTYAVTPATLSGVKLVRIVVRDHATPSRIEAREESTFDPLTGS